MTGRQIMSPVIATDARLAPRAAQAAMAVESRPNDSGFNDTRAHLKANSIPSIREYDDPALHLKDKQQVLNDLAAVHKWDNERMGNKWAE